MDLSVTAGSNKVRKGSLCTRLTLIMRIQISQKYRNNAKEQQQQKNTPKFNENQQTEMKTQGIKYAEK